MSWDTPCLTAAFIPLKELAKDPRPILNTIKSTKNKGYDIVCLPLTTDKWRNRWTDMCLLPPGFEHDKNVDAEQRAEAWRSKPSFLKGEVTITQLKEAEGVTIIVSDWLELDAADDWVRHDSEIALLQELSYASYLGVQTVVLPPPRNRRHSAAYGRAVSAALKAIPYMNISIRLPIYDPAIFQIEAPSPLNSRFSMPSPTFITSHSTPRLIFPPQPRGSSSGKPSTVRASLGDIDETWEMWDVIRSICDYNIRLSLTLDLTPPLPTSLGILNKWAAEPVRGIYLPSSSFIANNKGYPVLHKGTQGFIRESMAHRPTVILAGAQDGLHNKGGEDSYSQYMKHLAKTSPSVVAAQKEGTVEHFALGYQDYLQAPLQPLMDNLQSVTYQTFEQDPVKYKNYEEAVFRALSDRSQTDRLIICVAGAGRGPLVARCLTALERSSRTAMIYAVEKNPNAFVTLQGRKELEWGDRVELVFGDMRLIDIPEKADILVTELLGSFGDNELSPECLDGAVRFLKSDGISIPSSYTAHLAPLSSSRLFNEARSGKDLKSAETPYVVMFQAINILSGDGGGPTGRCGPQVQECWEFEHPRKDAVLDEKGLPPTNSHNARSAKLTYHIPHAGILHGLAGYFEAILYGNVGLSIHPRRKDQISKDMLSWFPLFFPFKEPLYLPSNSELQVSVWRLTNERQVWYEWHAESFLSVTTPAPPPASNSLMSPREQQRASSPLSPHFPSTPYTAMPSPLMDAVDVFSSPGRQSRRPSVESLFGDPESYGVVKIGQTSLHNPGGRSSWIGL